MIDETVKPRRGCFFYGCVISLVLLLLLAIAGLVAVHYAKKALTGVINNYTETQAMALPAVRMSPADFDALKKRIAAFQEGVKADRPMPPLALTADEINALIASGPDKHSLKGKLYVSFDDGRVKGELSLPLGDLGWKMVRGRYLNGSGTFDVSLRNGALSISPQSIVVKGRPVPEIYMKGIRNQNFAAAITNQPDATSVLQGLQELQVKDNKLVIVPKQVQ